uniref:Uncharacterized protein n=1 Tax=Chromera velia CCMP2878 TaxID=1169474 RepID=A0A0G4HE16_9ALVE|eukprot:Cvel_6466.t1-p1 / transcript=Cvel_6466.t1 / gene=Cvel_6466 / organism=Chromera_velia_CCMP2878 / gene_product=hypothetical protein / transcript_product=hypothetical protein / location=Cvel_scaffold317:2842-22982(-) / protein_length=3405 / sequence_SO=supercontig / SO=protein_coding / is_pseudo=false
MAPSPLKVLIVVSVVAVLGGGGYFLWNGMKAKGPSPTPSPSPSPTPAEPEQQAPPGGDGEKDEQPDTPRTKKTLDLQTGVGEVYIEGSHSANTDTGPSAGDVDGLLEGKANEGEDETEVIGEKPKPSEPIDPSSTDVFANPNSAQPETRDQTIKPASFEASPPAPKEETQTEETPAPPGPEKTVSPTEPEKKPVTKPSAPASQEEVEKELSKDAQWPRPKPSASVPAPAKKPTKKEEEKKPEEKGRVDFRALMKKQRPSKVYMPDPWSVTFTFLSLAAPTIMASNPIQNTGTLPFGARSPLMHIPPPHHPHLPPGQHGRGYLPFPVAAQAQAGPSAASQESSFSPQGTNPQGNPPIGARPEFRRLSSGTLPAAISPSSQSQAVNISLQTAPQTQQQQQQYYRVPPAQRQQSLPPGAAARSYSLPHYQHPGPPPSIPAMSLPSARPQEAKQPPAVLPASSGSQTDPYSLSFSFSAAPPAGQQTIGAPRRSSTQTGNHRTPISLSPMQSPQQIPLQNYTSKQPTQVQQTATQPPTHGHAPYQQQVPAQFPFGSHQQQHPVPHALPQPNHLPPQDPRASVSARGADFASGGGQRASISLSDPPAAVEAVATSSDGLQPASRSQTTAAAAASVSRLPLPLLRAEARERGAQSHSQIQGEREKEKRHTDEGGASAQDAQAIKEEEGEVEGDEGEDKKEEDGTEGLGAPPEPKGQPFRCQICQEIVFESQLEYHMGECPDPEHLPEGVHEGELAQGGGRGAGGEGRTGRAREAPQREGERDGGNTQVAASARPSGSLPLQASQEPQPPSAAISLSVLSPPAYPAELEEEPLEDFPVSAPPPARKASADKRVGGGKKKKQTSNSNSLGASRRLKKRGSLKQQQSQGGVPRDIPRDAEKRRRDVEKEMRLAERERAKGRSDARTSANRRRSPLADAADAEQQKEKEKSSMTLAGAFKDLGRQLMSMEETVVRLERRRRKDRERDRGSPGPSSAFVSRSVSPAGPFRFGGRGFPQQQQQQQYRKHLVAHGADEDDDEAEGEEEEEEEENLTEEQAEERRRARLKASLIEQLKQMKARVKKQEEGLANEQEQEEGVKGARKSPSRNPPDSRLFVSPPSHTQTKGGVQRFATVPATPNAQVHSVSDRGPSSLAALTAAYANKIAHEAAVQRRERGGGGHASSYFLRARSHREDPTLDAVLDSSRKRREKRREAEEREKGKDLTFRPDTSRSSSSHWKTLAKLGLVTSRPLRRLPEEVVEDLEEYGLRRRLALERRRRTEDDELRRSRSALRGRAQRKHRQRRGGGKHRRSGTSRDLHGPRQRQRRSLDMSRSSSNTEGNVAGDGGHLSEEEEEEEEVDVFDRLYRDSSERRRKGRAMERERSLEQRSSAGGSGMRRSMSSDASARGGLRQEGAMLGSRPELSDSLYTQALNRKERLARIQEDQVRGYKELAVSGARLGEGSRKFLRLRLEHQLRHSMILVLGGLESLELGGSGGRDGRGGHDTGKKVKEREQMAPEDLTIPSKALDPLLVSLGCLPPLPPLGGKERRARSMVTSSVTLHSQNPSVLSLGDAAGRSPARPTVVPSPRPRSASPSGRHPGGRRNSGGRDLQAQVAVSPEKRMELCRKMWRILDPDLAGSCSLETLSGFFFSLMGLLPSSSSASAAVGETEGEKRCSPWSATSAAAHSSASARKHLPPRTPGSPNLREKGAANEREAESSGMPLHANPGQQGFGTVPIGRTPEVGDLVTEGVEQEMRPWELAASVLKQRTVAHPVASAPLSLSAAPLTPIKEERDRESDDRESPRCSPLPLRAKKRAHAGGLEGSRHGKLVSPEESGRGSTREKLQEERADRERERLEALARRFPPEKIRRDFEILLLNRLHHCGKGVPQEGVMALSSLPPEVQGFSPSPSPGWHRSSAAFRPPPRAPHSHLPPPALPPPTGTQGQAGAGSVHVRVRMGAEGGSSDADGGVRELPSVKRENGGDEGEEGGETGEDPFSAGVARSIWISSVAGDAGRRTSKASAAEGTLSLSAKSKLLAERSAERERTEVEAFLFQKLHHQQQQQEHQRDAQRGLCTYAPPPGSSASCLPSVRVRVTQQGDATSSGVAKGDRERAAVSSLPSPAALSPPGCHALSQAPTAADVIRALEAGAPLPAPQCSGPLPQSASAGSSPHLPASGMRGSLVHAQVQGSSFFSARISTAGVVPSSAGISFSALRGVQQQGGGAGGSGGQKPLQVTHADLLQWRQRKREERLDNERRKAAAAEVDPLVFPKRPDLSLTARFNEHLRGMRQALVPVPFETVEPYSGARGSAHGHAEVRGMGLQQEGRLVVPLERGRKHEELLELGRVKRERKEAKAEAEARRREEKERAACPFRPQLVTTETQWYQEAKPRLHSSEKEKETEGQAGDPFSSSLQDPVARERGWKGAGGRWETPRFTRAAASTDTTKQRSGTTRGRARIGGAPLSVSPPLSPGPQRVQALPARTSTESQNALQDGEVACPPPPPPVPVEGRQVSRFVSEPQGRDRTRTARLRAAAPASASQSPRPSPPAASGSRRRQQGQVQGSNNSNNEASTSRTHARQHHHRTDPKGWTGHSPPKTATKHQPPRVDGGDGPPSRQNSRSIAVAAACGGSSFNRAGSGGTGETRGRGEGTGRATRGQRERERGEWEGGQGRAPQAHVPPACSSRKHNEKERAPVVSSRYLNPNPNAARVSRGGKGEKAKTNEKGRKVTRGRGGHMQAGGKAPESSRRSSSLTLWPSASAAMTASAQEREDSQPPPIPHGLCVTEEESSSLSALPNGPGSTVRSGPVTARGALSSFLGPGGFIISGAPFPLPNPNHQQHPLPQMQMPKEQGQRDHSFLSQPLPGATEGEQELCSSSLLTHTSNEPSSSFPQLSPNSAAAARGRAPVDPRGPSQHPPPPSSYTFSQPLHPQQQQQLQQALQSGGPIVSRPHLPTQAEAQGALSASVDAGGAGSALVGPLFHAEQQPRSDTAVTPMPFTPLTDTPASLSDARQFPSGQIFPLPHQQQQPLSLPAQQTASNASSSLPPSSLGRGPAPASSVKEQPQEPATSSVPSDQHTHAHAPHGPQSEPGGTSGPPPATTQAGSAPPASASVAAPFLGEICEEREVRLYVDVNISPDRTERLVVYRGQTAAEVSDTFAETHKLSRALRDKLERLLSAQMGRQDNDQHQQQQQQSEEQEEQPMNRRSLGGGGGEASVPTRHSFSSSGGDAEARSSFGPPTARSHPPAPQDLHTTPQPSAVAEPPENQNSDTSAPCERPSFPPRSCSGDGERDTDGERRSSLQSERRHSLRVGASAIDTANAHAESPAKPLKSPHAPSTHAMTEGLHHTETAGTIRGPAGDAHPHTGNLAMGGMGTQSNPPSLHMQNSLGPHVSPRPSGLIPEDTAQALAGHRNNSMDGVVSNQ